MPTSATNAFNRHIGFRGTCKLCFWFQCAGRRLATDSAPNAKPGFHQLPTTLEGLKPHKSVGLVLC